MSAARILTLAAAIGGLAVVLLAKTIATLVQTAAGPLSP